MARCKVTAKVRRHAKAPKSRRLRQRSKVVVVGRVTRSRTSTVNRAAAPPIIDEFKVDVKSEDESSSYDSDYSAHVVKSVRRHRRLRVKQHSCHLCNKCYSSQLALKQHVARKHSKCVSFRSGKPFACHRCDKRYTTIGSLNLHKLMHTGTKPYYCMECSKTYFTPTQLKRHLLTHTDVRPYKCEKCDKSFTTPSYLDKHSMTHDDAKLFHCQDCDKRFAFSWQLKTHAVLHSGEKPYRCELCDKSYSWANTLTDHMRTHLREKEYRCNVCQFFCYTVYELSRHRRVHLVPNFACDACDKKFSIRRHLTAHVENNHSDVVHTCDACQQSFRTQRMLERHAMRHFRERIYHCQQCRQTFFTASYLMRHVEKHADKPPMRCRKCGYLTYTMFDIETHRMMHSVKIYTCDICSDDFKHHYDLKRHMKSEHTVAAEAKPQSSYRCDRCDKTYRFRKSLEQHAMIHSGQKAYFCQECDRKFYTPAQLKYHAPTHSRVRYNCMKCRSNFTKPELLVKHIRMHDELLPCPHCNKILPDIYRHQAHVARFSGQMPKICCKTCGKRLSTTANLSAHMKTHDRGRHRLSAEHRCEVCQDGCYASSGLCYTLKQLLGTPTSTEPMFQMPYKCEPCGEAFPHQSNLEAHMTKHEVPAGSAAADDEDAMFGMDGLLQVIIVKPDEHGPTSPSADLLNISTAVHTPIGRSEPVMLHTSAID